MGDDPLAPKPTRVRYQVLAAACALAVLTYVQRLGFMVGLPEIKKSVGLNDTQAGLLWSAFLIAYGSFQVPGGLLGDRFGARHVLTALVVGWSLLTAAVALAVFLPEVWLAFAFLLVLRFLFGALQAGGFPVLARVLADWMPMSQRGVAQGTVWTFSRLGGAAVSIVFAGLVFLCHGWATPFVLLGALGLLWAAVFWPWFRNRPEEMKQVNAAERDWIEGGRGKRTEVARTPLPWSRFLRSRNVWALCLLYGFGGFAGNFFTSLLSVYLHDHRKLSDEATGLLSALPLIFGLVSCLLGGVVSDALTGRMRNRRWGRSLTGSVGVALAGAALLASVWAEPVWLLGFLLSVTFFFNDSGMAPAWAACADVGERHAGALSGAMNMTGAIFGAVGAAFAGNCFDHHRYVLLFVVFACSYGLASLCWLAVDVNRPLVPRAATESA
jgi:sugar phosphate permease